MLPVETDNNNRTQVAALIETEGVVANFGRRTSFGQLNIQQLQDVLPAILKLHDFGYVLMSISPEGIGLDVYGVYKLTDWSKLNQALESARYPIYFDYLTADIETDYRLSIR